MASVWGSDRARKRTRFVGYVAGDSGIEDYYDHLPLHSVESRIRSLAPAEVQSLLAYEQAHGSRLPVMQVLQTRLRQLDGGAAQTSGDPAALAPELAPAPNTGGRVEPQTSGPPVNPPSQGDPTNPAQPR